jgi:hypothetical protein
MKKAASGWAPGRLMFAPGRTLDFPSYYLVQGL